MPSFGFRFRTIVRGFAGLTVFCAIVALAPRAVALPLYATRQGLPCMACHFDPDGGGPRNDFGFQFEKNRHDLTPDERWADLVLANRVGDALYFGTNMRQQYTYVHAVGTGQTGVSTFFPMQGALYATFAPLSKLTIVYSRDLRETRDAWGMIHDLPVGLTIKAGQFRVPFGLRNDDHTNATRAGFREALAGSFGTSGLLPYDPRGVEGGVEVSVTPFNATNLTLTAALTNGGPAFANRAQAITGKLWYNESFHMGGLSYYDNWRSTTGLRDQAVSYYAGLAVAPRLTVLGEVGWARSELGPGAGVRYTYAFWGEADYKVSRTVLVRVKYDYVDLNTDIEGAAQERFTGETDLTFIPFADLKASYRYVVPEDAPNENQVLLQWHFYY
ncbi:MAG: hypothetical protein ACREOU_15575 [Candidatus Eiseniibacteriota bacterium]